MWIPPSGMGPTEVQCTERQMSNFRIPSYAASELRVRDTSLSSVSVKTRLSTHVVGIACLKHFLPVGTQTTMYCTVLGSNDYVQIRVTDLNFIFTTYQDINPQPS